MSSRITNTFEKLQSEGRQALVPYITPASRLPPSRPRSCGDVMEGGADVIELGVPFSDPMADGPVIQKAGDRAIANGVNLKQVIAYVREFRQKNQTTPVVLMGYASLGGTLRPAERRRRLRQHCAEAGVDGVLIVDYPPEECQEFAAKLRARNMDLIFLLAPTSTDERMQQVAAVASGYVYYVSLKGVTGSGALDTAAVEAMLPRIRQHVKIPVGVGFGIRDAQTAQTLSRFRMRSSSAARSPAGAE